MSEAKLNEIQTSATFPLSSLRHTVTHDSTLNVQAIFHANQPVFHYKQTGICAKAYKKKVFSACFCVRATCRADVKLWSWPGYLPSLKLRNWTQFETGLEAKCSQLSHFIYFFLRSCGSIFQHELKPQLIQWPCQYQDMVSGTRVPRKYFIVYYNSYNLITFNIFFKGLIYSIMYPHSTLSSC